MDKKKELTADNFESENLETEDKETEEAEIDKEGDAEPQEKGNFFTEALAALQKERDQYYDQLLRKQAEFENYRKRVEKEKADARFAAKQEILRELLNVLDACERGLESMKRSKTPGADLESYREGYELLYRQIQTLLAKFGVEEVPAVGEQFDPNIHEAVLHELSDSHRGGEVMEEIQKGYRLHDRLLRPAQVKVARTR
ncbi:MAG TPA: nucleotide exchange factor GrpE [Acidobacteriota bacterium]|jgi:molecular chaperone GrpE|nr:nucleotide exchange factor GrpE [Acidobacteriota bacterium]